MKGTETSTPNATPRFSESFGHYERRQWYPNPSGPSRKQRRGGFYETFVPVSVAKRPFQLDDEAVATVAEATKALSDLNGSSPRLASMAALASNLIRSEAVASSRLEGLVLSHKRLARAAYAGDGRRSGDRRAAEILANVSAMEQAVVLGTRATPLGVSDIQNIHRTLLRFTWDEMSGDHPRSPKLDRRQQLSPARRRICASGARARRASHGGFVRVHQPRGLRACRPGGDSSRAVRDNPPVCGWQWARGSSPHLHDLRRRHESPRYIPPISLVLASEPKDYIGGLIDYRDGRISDWCTLFAAATRDAALQAGEFSDRIEALQQGWIERLGNPRSGSAVRQLIA